MKRAGWILILSCVVQFAACDNNRASYVSLFDPAKIAGVIGTEFVDSDGADSYRIISWSYVDYGNNVYVGDPTIGKIDKYNKFGRYVMTIGGPGQGPGEFSRGFPVFCADSKGYVLTSVMKAISIFDDKGKYLEDIAYPDDFKGYYCAKIKADHNDDVVILLFNTNAEFAYLKFSRADKSFRPFHADAGRKGKYSSIFRFTPDYDFDDHNNIYILDSVDNRIYIYDPSGKPIKTIAKNAKKHRITAKDLYFSRGNHVVEKFPEANLKGLTGDTAYFPVNYGINIDGGVIFLWKSDLDADYKHIVEIFDNEFRFLGRSSYYNLMNSNTVHMRNGFAYVLNIGDEDREYKRNFGRAGLFNPPTKIICYRYDFP